MEGTGNMGCKKDLFAVETPEDPPDRCKKDLLKPPRDNTYSIPETSNIEEEETPQVRNSVNLLYVCDNENGDGVLVGAPEDLLVDAQVVHTEDDVLGGEILNSLSKEYNVDFVVINDTQVKDLGDNVEGTGNMGRKKDLLWKPKPQRIHTSRILVTRIRCYGFHNQK